MLRNTIAVHPINNNNILLYTLSVLGFFQHMNEASFVIAGFHTTRLPAH